MVRDLRETLREKQMHQLSDSTKISFEISVRDRLFLKCLRCNKWVNDLWAWAKARNNEVKIQILTEYDSSEVSTSLAYQCAHR